MFEDVRANRDAGLLTLLMIITLRLGRASRVAKGTKAALLAPVRLLTAIMYRALAVLMNCSVPFSATIGPRVRWQHGFSGIFIARDTVIGADCIILHQVTIGSNIGAIGKERHSPTIGAKVLIGAGAKVIGGVAIGDGARIGANAVVVSDIPPGATCVGPPATVRDSSVNQVPR